ncbi:uncharacterized protein LOC127137087 [Lathyrus oleraceus]|uniref:uncharacterized protein LOC127137087 n=1 Tax=Pisum sativum TaxID=3888 RepID=UPI0021CFA5C8|nr:uncharacterized protein LOC127137087 [Pisum sativum]
MDSKIWKAIIKSWEHPVVNDKDGKATTDLKPEEGWSKEEDVLTLRNSKALNSLFNGVDKKIFRLINTCTIAKDASEILKTTHKGTSKVKMSRLHLLTTRFENLKIKDDENIHEFHMIILEIANSSSALGEKMSEEKLVRKIIRSLPKKFDIKVTTIEEAQDINTMRVDELIGSLQTFELVKQMGDTIFISQSKYAKSIVKKPGMENASHKRTPAPTHLKLTKDEKASRPDITFVVGVCARYKYEPKMSHITQDTEMQTGHAVLMIERESLEDVSS